MRRRSKVNHTVDKKIVVIKLIEEEIEEKEEKEIEMKKKVRRE